MKFDFTIFFMVLVILLFGLILYFLQNNKQYEGYEASSSAQPNAAINDLEVKLTGLKSDKKSLEDTNKTLNNRNIIIKEEIPKLKTNRTIAKNDLKSYTDSHKSYKNLAQTGSIFKRPHYRSERDKYRNLMYGAESQIANLKSQIRVLRTEKRNNDKTIYNNDNKIKELNSNIDQINKQIDQLKPPVPVVSGFQSSMHLSEIEQFENARNSAPVFSSLMESIKPVELKNGVEPMSFMSGSSDNISLFNQYTDIPIANNDQFMRFEEPARQKGPLCLTDDLVNIIKNRGGNASL
jgi:hypothetical protein